MRQMAAGIAGTSDVIRKTEETMAEFRRLGQGVGRPFEGFNFAVLDVTALIKGTRTTR